MSTTVLWILLALFVVGCLAAAVAVSLRLGRLFIRVRDVERELLPLVDGLAQRTDLAAGRAAALGEQGAVLNERMAALQGSVARLMVLVRAIQEAAQHWGRLRRYLA